MDLYSQFTWLNQLLRSQYANGAIEASADYSADTANASDHVHGSNETANVYASAAIDSNAVNGCGQTVDYTQLMQQFNQSNEHFLAALLKKGTSPITAALASASQQHGKQQATALIPPTPPRTPITQSAPQQQQVSATMRNAFFFVCVCLSFVVLC